MDRLDRDSDSALDATLDLHRICSGHDILGAFAIDRLSQHCRRRRTVAGNVGCLAGNLAHHLGTHVLERVREVDLSGDRHAVLRDRRRPERLLKDDIASLGAESDLHRVGKLVDAARHHPS